MNTHETILAIASRSGRVANWMPFRSTFYCALLAKTGKARFCRIEIPNPAYDWWKPPVTSRARWRHRHDQGL